MSTPHSLETEKQSILERMQMSREDYRRMLRDGAEIIPQMSEAPHHHITDHHVTTTYTPGQFPRSVTMRWITQHPLLCAAAVAAVLFIGPRKIARTIVSSGATVSDLTLRNPANIDLITRLLTMVMDYAQQNRPPISKHKIH